MNDLRYALRQLRHHPVFAGVAVATLGLGIGVNTAIFSAARETMRPQLPFVESERLVRIYQVPPSGTPRISPRSPVFMATRDAADGFEHVVASRFTDLTMRTATGPERIVGNVITPGWLSALGVQPMLGRRFTAEEEAAGVASGAAVISYRMWQGRLGGARDVIGTVVSLNGNPFTVVGVLPAGFTYPYNSDVWIPFRPEHDSGEAFWALNIKARLRPEVTLAAVSRELENVSAEIAGQTPGFGGNMVLRAVPVREMLVGDEGRTVIALSAAVGFLLLVVCANLASLLLSRALARETEFALRSSLGASRPRLLRQALVESVTLGVVGGVVGVWVAYLGTGLLEPLVPARLFDLGVQLAIDEWALVFATVTSVSTGVLLGLVPALRLSATNAGSLLRRGAQAIAGPRHHRLAGGLVVAELAVTLVLLSGVGLMVRDFQRLQSVELGYDPSGLTVFSVALDREPYLDPSIRVQFAERLLSELQATPGVGTAAGTSMFPRHRGNTLASLEPEGGTNDPDALPTVNHRLVTPEYLESLGARLLRGRWLRDTDRDGAPRVALVNASLARRFWPNEDPVGRRLRNRRVGPDAPWHTVVGVVSDVREADDIADAWYLPYAQHAAGRGGAQLTFAVRGADGEQTPPSRTIEDALHRIDPDLPTFDAVTAPMLNIEALDRERYGALLGSVFAVFGLVLAALGVYGSISYAVAGRMREFGLRMALGGERGEILRDVLGRVGRLVAIGAALGIGGAVGVTRVVGANLSEVGSFDPIALGAALVLLSVTGLAAGAIPAWRAMRVDPVVALRSE